MGAFGIKELLVIAVIVLLLFGTKKLRGMGGDIGAAIKGFKKAMNEDDPKADAKDADFTATENSAEVEDKSASATTTEKSNSKEQG
uniref:twin-arginine translocase TatA/TatE family subunit n=1 Tax=Thaumasiovibrio occultus TaxID=1891184 RepID=UPI000B34E1D2|nr:twin-arginine translocase TatA/TatE family subunit [Thaumasiovibrio occultus]